METTGGEWASKAKTMDAAKLDNACPHPIYTYGMEYQGWHRLARDERVVGRVRG